MTLIPKWINHSQWKVIEYNYTSEARELQLCSNDFFLRVCNIQKRNI